MSIYIITHKKFKRVPSQIDDYETLLVGAAGKKIKTDYLKDNAGINISEKNGSFCELTGEYWVWKNKTDSFVGFDHYRRYFVKRKTLFLAPKMLEYQQIEKDLKSYDIILPQKVNLEQNAKDQFAFCHDPEVWKKMKNIIASEFPEYIKDVNWFEKEEYSYCFNMFITKRELMNEYFNWLFTILFKLEKQVNLSEYNNYNKRMFGFVSERLLNIWIHHNSLNIKEYPVYFYDGMNIWQKLIKKFNKKRV